MTEFLKEMEIAARCIRYVERRLAIDKAYLEKNRSCLSDCAIRTHEYNIAFMEYALGKSNYPPRSNPNNL